jgi:hypothetical protein
MDELESAESGPDPQPDQPYVLLDEPRPDRRRALRPVVAGAAVVLLMVVTGLVLVRPSSVHGKPSTRDVGVVTPEAPWDGKQSHRLPITVTPDDGLIDGQSVTITGSGFPRGKSVAAVVCTIDAGSKGADACDISTSSFMAGTTTIVDSDGRFSLTYKVHRRIDVGGKTIDCATGNVDPHAYHQSVVEFGPFVRISTPGAFACLIGVGAIDNYDQSGGVLVAFAGETYLPFDVDRTAETTTSTTAAVAPPVGSDPIGPGPVDPTITTDRSTTSTLAIDPSTSTSAGPSGSTTTPAPTGGTAPTHG